MQVLLLIMSSSPTFHVSLCGDMRWPHNFTWGYSVWWRKCLLQVPECKQTFQAWIEEMSAYVKSLDPTHLVSINIRCCMSTERNVVSKEVSAFCWCNTLFHLFCYSICSMVWGREVIWGLQDLWLMCRWQLDQKASLGKTPSRWSTIPKHGVVR